jgi:hypothetical protein
MKQTPADKPTDWDKSPDNCNLKPAEEAAD